MKREAAMLETPTQEQMARIIDGLGISADRAWVRPDPALNPFNAWYVTTSIGGAAAGPLRGRSCRCR
jgi:hypothetical protein